MNYLVLILTLLFCGYWSVEMTRLDLLDYLNRKSTEIMFSVLKKKDNKKPAWHSIKI